MASTKPHEPQSVPRGDSTPERASEWTELCVKHFELNLLDAIRGLPSGASDRDYWDAAVRAMLENLLNLVYACRRCNLVKRDQSVPDPFKLLQGGNVATGPDGSLHASDREMRRLILQLDLNSPRLKQWRRMWTRIVTLAEQRDDGLYCQLVGFPDELPDLSKPRPPHNRRERGVGECWFALRRRGELPKAY